MLTVHYPRGTILERQVVDHSGDIPKETVWIDLFNPAMGEDKLVERTLGIAVPTREEMQEIEVSSRLYEENGARYMTATMICQADTPNPKITAVTFILTEKTLITVRYDDPRPFPIVSNKLNRVCPANITGQIVLNNILEAIIDRAADILERIGGDVDRVSHDVFEPEGRRTNRSLTYRYILKSVGKSGDLTSKIRESLVSIGRLVLFLLNEPETGKLTKDFRAELKSMQRDVQSLLDHTTYLTNNITFLLDAMVGFVTIEQNNVIKIFSVVSVVLMPPTLVASIYGMNFKHMPELDWALGYPFAVGLMLAAAVVPYVFFKWRRWL
ncbi:MAG: magnesium transporter CorA family protein [Planctomycetaceae bacterium]|nr:magnesium transporter CorA family protein [Planctomycetaceae bacterium]